MTSEAWPAMEAVVARLERLPSDAGSYVMVEEDFAFHRAMVAGVVLSHWLLDFVSHRPDLPLYPGSTLVVGLGLLAVHPGGEAAARRVYVPVLLRITGATA